MQSMAKGRSLYSLAASRRVANARFLPPIMTSIRENEVKKNSGNFAIR